MGQGMATTLAREVERRSDDALTFASGTLYTYLRAMEKEGFVESTWEQPEGERQRRVYVLTAKGNAEVERFLKEWEDFSTAMNKVIGRRSGEQTA